MSEILYPTKFVIEPENRTDGGTVLQQQDV